ncbi:hypothetical protein, partial [Kaarinaea lacus]
TIYLENAPLSPMDITATVENASHALVSANQTTAGSPSIVLSGVTDTSAGNIYVQGLLEGTTTITLSAPGYNDGTVEVIVNPSSIYIVNSSFSTTTFADNSLISIRSARLRSDTLLREDDQEVRGGYSVSVPLSNSDDSVGTISTNNVTFTGGTGYQQIIEFDAIASGTTTLSLAQPAGFTQPAGLNTSIDISVTAPDIYLQDSDVGYNLQEGVNVQLQSAPPAPVDITFTVEDESVALVAPDNTTLGARSITISGVTTQYVGNIYIHGLQSGSTTTLTATAEGYDIATSNITVTPSAIRFLTSTLDTNTFSENELIYLYPTRLNEGSLTFVETQQIRGGITINVPLSNTDDLIGTISTDNVIFEGGQSARTVEFDPITAGFTQVSLTQPPGFSVPANEPTTTQVNVTAPDIFVINYYDVGAGLQEGLLIQLEETPPSPVNVTFTISSGAIALISTDQYAQGTTEIVFSNVTSTTVGIIYLQGIVEGNTQLLGKASGYDDAIVPVTVTPGALYLSSSDINVADDAPNVTMSIRSARLNPVTWRWERTQSVRGGLTVSIAFSNTDPSVGIVTPNPLVITGGNSLYTTEFDPLSAGVTEISLIPPVGFTPVAGSEPIRATVTQSTVNVTGNTTVIEAIETSETEAIVENNIQAIDSGGGALNLSTLIVGAIYYIITSMLFRRRRWRE